MRRSIDLASLTVLALTAVISGCAGVDGIWTRAGPPAQIPCFAADDPRVGTAGFVRETLRLSVMRGEIKHTLLAFVVGDTLTLGAMVSGEFRGLVRFKIGARRISFLLNTDASLREVVVQVEGEPDAAKLTGQGATFRGISWVNVELPLAAWLRDGTALQLVFLPEVGASPLFLPDDGFHYLVELKRAR